VDRRPARSPSCCYWAWPRPQLRNGGGCTDTNANNLDFTVATPVPRNSATASNQCSCSGSLTTGNPADISSMEGDDTSSFISLP